MYNFRLIEERVRDHLRKYDAGHDWYHVDRVRRNAKRIALAERADEHLVKAIALTHDVADHKFVKDNRREILLTVLEEVVPEDSIPPIVDAWENISWSKGRMPGTLEGRIVQDADRLDAIGAIGILRAAAYSGHKGRILVDPFNFLDPETTTGHFYEKLLKLRESMNTAMGRALAEERHSYMVSFLDQLDGELQ